MIRILFMHQVSGIGGGSYCLLNVVKCIDRTIWEPVVALRSNGLLADELKRIGVEVIIFPQMTAIPYNKSLTFRNLLTYWQAVSSEKELEKLLRSAKVDVLYLNNMMIAPYLRPAKKVGCKTVMHVREHWPLNEHKKQLEWLRKIVYANCDKTIAINHYSASIFPQKEASIVYDWIDMNSRYKPIPMNELFGEDVKGKKVFLYLGGMQRIKGAFEVIKTFSELLKGDEYRLLVLGFTKEISSQNGIRGSIKKILSKIGIFSYEYKVKREVWKDNRIVCIPGVFELTDLLKQSYAVLSYFTMPHANLSLAEAIIVGTPVIAARTEEADEYSLNGELARLFEFNNIDAFKQAIKDFDRDRALICTSLASDGRKVIEKMFSRQENEERINKALRELV